MRTRSFCAPGACSGRTRGLVEAMRFLRRIFGGRRQVLTLVETAEDRWRKRFERCAVELYAVAFENASAHPEIIHWPQTLSDGPYCFVGDAKRREWIKVSPCGWWERIRGYWVRGRYDADAHGRAKWRSDGEPQAWDSSQVMDHDAGCRRVF